MAIEQTAAAFGISLDPDAAPDFCSAADPRVSANCGTAPNLPSAAGLSVSADHRAADLRSAADPAVTADLEALAHKLLRTLPAASLEPFLALWPAAAQPPGLIDAMVAAPALPVLGWLPMIANSTGGFGAELIVCLCRIGTSLQWRQTYSSTEADPAFLRNYGYTEISGPTALRQSATLACGFLLLGPATLYPRHYHEAEEIYVTLSGDAEWLQGDSVWRERPPGTVVHHASGELHAMRTGKQPLLALYLWRSTDLHQKARLHSNDEPAR